MAKIIKGVFHKQVRYNAGDDISNLPKEDIELLVKLGYAEETAEQTEEIETPEVEAETEAKKGRKK